MDKNSSQPDRSNVYVIDGSRTPFLKTRGLPGPFRASDLALQCGRPLLARQPFTADALDEVILGCVSSGPDEANIARVVALRLGCSEQVPAWTVQRNCASGLQALDSAAQSIATGRSGLVLAGGTESMSHHPIMLNQMMAAWLGSWNRTHGAINRARHIAKLRPNHLHLVIALLRGLRDPVVGLSMGQTAEKLATIFAISRAEMDAYAIESHQRLAQAINSDWLQEIEPMYAADGSKYLYDEGLREDSNQEALSRLKPVFDRPVGRVTAGNSAQVSDGAALLLLASGEAVRHYKLPWLGRIIDTEWGALDPTQMGLGPVHAMVPIMQRHGLKTDDIDSWEINEAFAAQILACLSAWSSSDYCRSQLGLDEPFDPIPSERLNRDGGGISLGHPVGASGARIVLHLLHVLARTNGYMGMASLCIGGGQGGAMLLELNREVTHG